MKTWPWHLRDFWRRSKAHVDPVPDGMFRLMVLTDDPYPTYIGYRAWCSGEPFWMVAGQRHCKCQHTEDRDA